MMLESVGEGARSAGPVEVSGAIISAPPRGHSHLQSQLHGGHWAALGTYWHVWKAKIGIIIIGIAAGIMPTIAFRCLRADFFCCCCLRPDFFFFSLDFSLRCMDALRSLHLHLQSHSHGGHVLEAMSAGIGATEEGAVTTLLLCVRPGVGFLPQAFEPFLRQPAFLLLFVRFGAFLPLPFGGKAFLRRSPPLAVSMWSSTSLAASPCSTKASVSSTASPSALFTEIFAPSRISVTEAWFWTTSWPSSPMSLAQTTESNNAPCMNKVRVHAMAGNAGMQRCV
mmetsp:Transcript_4860/g.13530  ORF Transcript_4860/g.13530 Transcript_4860/m.13530 type:complete len:281 (+) Transcript_4860:200-1042(+)